MDLTRPFKSTYKNNSESFQKPVGIAVCNQKENDGFVRNFRWDHGYFINQIDS